MTTKSIARITILAVLAMLAALIPLQVRAGGVCGGTYTVEKGDTVEKLASLCGTTTSAIFAANPGLKEPLTAGQNIIIPAPNFNFTSTATFTATVTGTPKPPVTPSPTPSATPAAVTNIYNYYNYYNYYNNVPAGGYVTTYTVQAGDTFDGIAAKFNVPVYDLWMANLQIPNVQQLTVGQIIYIPATYWADSYPSYYPTTVVSAVVQEPSKLVYMGDVPAYASRGTVELVNSSRAEVYVSLRSNRADGTVAIHEYPVKGSLGVDIPTGWIDYVAWVGGVKYTGGFQLKEDAPKIMTFLKNRVEIADMP